MLLFDNKRKSPSLLQCWDNAQEIVKHYMEDKDAVYLQSRKGFIINEDVAEQLGVLEEYLIWENDYDEEILLERFEELHNVLPDRLEVLSGEEVAKFRVFRVLSMTYLILFSVMM